MFLAEGPFAARTMPGISAAATPAATTLTKVRRFIMANSPRSGFMGRVLSTYQSRRPRHVDEGRRYHAAGFDGRGVEMRFRSPADSPLDELLTAVDVEGRTRDRRVRHEMDGQCGDVGRADDAPDRQRLAELLAAFLQLIAEDRRRQRRVDEPGRDQVHADGREFEREVLRDGGTCGRERRDERESRRRAAATGAAHEEQRPSRTNLARGVPSDLERQQDVGVDIVACLFDVELRQPRVIGTGAGDQHVVDRCGQLVEEFPEPFEVSGVERGGAGPELAADALQAIRVTRCEDHVGALGAGAPRRLEPDARAAADHDDGLAGEGAHSTTARSGFPFSTTYVASSAPRPVPTFFAEWIVPYGMNRTSPALSVTGGLPSTVYSSSPSRT